MAAHELGHVLALSWLYISSDPHHDPGPFPDGTCGLMKSGQPVGGLRSPMPCGKWLRHQDWEAANDKANEILHSN